MPPHMCSAAIEMFMVIVLPEFYQVKSMHNLYMCEGNGNSMLEYQNGHMTNCGSLLEKNIYIAR